MALERDDSPETDDRLLVARRYLGVKIEVPALAKTYVGDTVPSCPLLAATWQKRRLGPLGHSAGIKQWGQGAQTSRPYFHHAEHFACARGNGCWSDLGHM